MPIYSKQNAQFFNATDEEALQAVKLVARMEGIIPALEVHAIAALEKLNANPNETVIVNLSGRGDKDLDTYIRELKL